MCRVRDTTDVQPLPTSTGVLVKMELGRVSNNNNILEVVSVLLYIWRTLSSQFYSVHKIDLRMCQAVAT